MIVSSKFVKVKGANGQFDTTASSLHQLFIHLKEVAASAKPLQNNYKIGDEKW